MIGVVGGIVLRGSMKRCDAYGAFLRGARRGAGNAVALLPALCAMMFMLAVVTGSGMDEGLTTVLRPMAEKMGLPGESVPVLLLRPMTGAGSIAALEELIEKYGADSRPGRIGAALLGSSETIFYTMTVYLGAAGIRRAPYALAASLIGYTAGVLACAALI